MFWEITICKIMKHSYTEVTNRKFVNTFIKKEFSFFLKYIFAEINTKN